MATVRARSLYFGEQFTVTVMELFEARIERARSRRFVTGGMKPIAVIVRERDRIYALDMTGRPVDIHRPGIPDGDLAGTARAHRNQD